MGGPPKGEGRLSGLRVALVFPVFIDVELASYQDNAKYLGAIPPISLGYVAAVLEGAGAEVLLLDCPTLGMRLDRAVDVVRAFKPDYVGFTLATVDWLSSLTWMQGFKDALGVPIVVGGIHMECYPRETMTHECIDIGLVGHADQGLVELLALHQEGGDLARIAPLAVPSLQPTGHDRQPLRHVARDLRRADDGIEGGGVDPFFYIIDLSS